MGQAIAVRTDYTAGETRPDRNRDVQASALPEARAVGKPRLEAPAL
jgi:hypothetical protein